MRALQGVAPHGQVHHFHGHGNQRNQDEPRPQVLRACAERRGLRKLLHRQVAPLCRQTRAPLRPRQLVRAAGCGQAGLRRVLCGVQLPSRILRAEGVLPPRHPRKDLRRGLRARFHDRPRNQTVARIGGGGQAICAVFVTGHPSRPVDKGECARKISGYVRRHGLHSARELLPVKRLPRRPLGEIPALRARQNHGVDEGVLRNGGEPRRELRANSESRPRARHRGQHHRGVHLRPRRDVRRARQTREKHLLRRIGARALLHQVGRQDRSGEQGLLLQHRRHHAHAPLSHGIARAEGGGGQGPVALHDGRRGQRGALAHDGDGPHRDVRQRQGMARRARQTLHLRGVSPRQAGVPFRQPQRPLPETQSCARTGV